MRCSRDGSRVGRIFPVTPHGPTTMTLLLARAIAFLFFVGLVAPGTAAADAGPPSPPEWQGHWSGTVAFRGDAWPIRLALPGELADATIDLPDLWMTWEPVTVNTGIDADAVVVALPFGLGDVPLARCGADLCGTRAIGKDTLAVVLQRDAALELKRLPVALRSGAATLQGEFLAPPGEDLPAVVLVHGARNNARADWNYRSAADFWLRRGHAVLLYDKRGTGDSTGEWMTTSFADLADLGADLRAALDWLSRRPEVDPARVGVHGGSQALWTLAIATQRGARPAFAVLSGAPATTPLVQERDAVLRALGAADLTEAERDAARAHVERYFRAAADPASSPAAIASSRAAAGTTWAALVPTAATDDDFYWWRRNHGYDPAAALQAWDMPVLLLYGEADTIAAPALHLPRMRELLDEDRLTVATFPGAVHNLELPAGRDASGQWRFPRRHPGVATAIEAWLATRRAMLASPDARTTPR